MANYSPTWRAHAAGAQLVQCLRGAGQGPRAGRTPAHEAGPKAVQEPKHRRGQIAAAKKKKKKEEEEKKAARKLGAQCPSLANQCGRAGVGSWGSFAPHRLQSHRLQEKEQENKKKAWDAPKVTTFKLSWGDLA